jgi:hypothetical protein
MFRRMPLRSHCGRLRKSRTSHIRPMSASRNRAARRLRPPVGSNWSNSRETSDYEVIHQRPSDSIGCDEREANVGLQRSDHRPTGNSTGGLRALTTLDRPEPYGKRFSAFAGLESLPRLLRRHRLDSSARALVFARCFSGHVCLALVALAVRLANAVKIFCSNVEIGTHGTSSM